MDMEEDLAWWSHGVLDNATGPVTEEVELALNTGSTVALILPRITAALSLLAVVCVFLEAFLEARATKRQVIATNGCQRIRSGRAASNLELVNHIQLFYQVPLFCYSLALALGTNPVPNELDVWGAAGTTATCSSQGFLLTFGILGSIGWDAALSAAYLGMTRGTVQAQRNKTLCHLIIWPLALALSIYPLVTGLYNFSYNSCWIHEFPNDCDGDECIRGEGAELWSSLVSLTAVLHLVYSIVVMIGLYCTIRGMEDRTLSATTGSRDGSVMDASAVTTGTTTRTYSRAVGIQGMLYTSGMILTMLPTALYTMLYNTTGIWNEGFSIFALAMTPLVGYVNFCIFMRNRRLEDCRTRYGKLLRRAHGWLFDYHFRSECNCQCLPRFCSRKIDTGRTHPASLPPVGERKAVMPPPPQQQSAKPASKWVGFLIATQPRAPAVSALGLSSVGRSTTDDHWCDDAPSKPRRVKSQVEQPPTAPVRLASEVDLDISHQATAGGGNRAPVQPIRLESHVEEGEEEDFATRPPSQPIRLVSEIETIPEAGSLPPSKPIRIVSEVELPDLQAMGPSSTSHYSMERSQRPPSKPVRHVSELEMLDDSEDGQSRQNHEAALPPQPTRYESKVELPLEQVDEHITSPSTMANCSNRERLPPSQPTRSVSEIEPLEEQVAAVALPTNAMQTTHVSKKNTSFVPPSKPRRYESEIDE